MPKSIKYYLEITLIALAIFSIFTPHITHAISVGERANFFVDPDFDLYGRSQITAVLRKITNQTYIYVDTKMWDNLDTDAQNQIDGNLYLLANQFENHIYPKITSTFGHEWRPGIDGDTRITILFFPMKKGDRSYFNSGDEYYRLQNPRSNEREMVYINFKYVNSQLAKSYLAHEFTLLVSFNQKDRKYGVTSETWLDEARAEYAPTLIGYDDSYEGSALQERVNEFLTYPSNSLTVWNGTPADYGALNLFTQYLVEHYGLNILVDSLHSPKTGIASINEALKKNGFADDFSQIFTNWTIASLVNDCSLGNQYCYLNPILKRLSVAPSTNFLPIQGTSNLGVTQHSQTWSGNWIKIIGGREGTLKITFLGRPGVDFRVPYVTKSLLGQYSINFFHLDNYQKGQVFVPDFGTKILSVTLIPSIQNILYNPDGVEPFYPFFWEASTVSSQEKAQIDNDSNKNLESKYLNKPLSQMTEEEVSSTISDIQALLQDLQKRLAEIKEEQKKAVESASSSSLVCKSFDKNLYYGIKDKNDVKCLQQFLKNQGKDIYPEGLITGNFLSLTKRAVIKFQEKFASDILEPLGLKYGTGFVGERTREKINEMIRRR